MKTVTLAAPAKLNLTLEILGLRPDGYHELTMLMQAVSLSDSVTVVQGTGKPWALSCETPTGQMIPDLPCDSRNLAWKAAECFFRHTGLPDGGISIRIVKRIPAQAGLAGGSADAAAVLRGLNECSGFPLDCKALCALGADCGSDVPFCVLGGTALVQGRGERVNAVPLERVQHYVICKPPFGISTAKLYAQADRFPSTLRPDPAALLACLRRDAIAQAGALLCNALEAVAVREHPALLAVRQDLLEAGACGARMTGSGSAVFGLFPDEAAAKAACEGLKGKPYAVFYAHSVGHL